MYHFKKNQISVIVLINTDRQINEKFITVNNIKLTCNISTKMCLSEILIKMKIS